MRPRKAPSSERSASKVTAHTTRRRFTAEFKCRILQQAESCKRTGGLGALLRGENLCASHIANWRAQAASGILASLAPKKRGPPKDLDISHNRALSKMGRDITHWKRRALRAEALVNVQRTSLEAIKDNAAKAAKRDLTRTVFEAAPELGVSSSCTAFGVARSTYYRELTPQQGPKQQRVSAQRLSNAKRQIVWDALHEFRFMGVSPRVIHATLLNEGRQLCSVSTMRRILAERDRS